jgi:hypothetical protein
VSDKERQVTLVVLAVMIVVHGWCITQIGIRLAALEVKEVACE